MQLLASTDEQPGHRACRPEGVAFEAWLAKLESAGRRLWEAGDPTTPRLGAPVGGHIQRRNAARCSQFLGDLAVDIESLPEDQGALRAWRRRLQEKARRLAEQTLGWPQEVAELPLADDFLAATQAFVRRARDFDSSLGTPEILQALRNVWIANSLQVLFGLEVELTPAIFAYSMMYPYTDNYLDDPEIALASKQAWNQAVAHRLAGRSRPAFDARQARVFQLVGVLERQYPQARWPRVFASLRAIHRAQTGSLRQQGTTPRPQASQVLRISLAKGGASVLADGYLAAGSLTPGQAHFCFGYGALLQLLDDLQDVTPDLKAGHWTLFSLAARAGHLDHLASRLHAFLRGVMQAADGFPSLRAAECKELIARNCVHLLVTAVADNPEYFTRRFRRRLQRGYPLRLAALSRIHREAGERLQAAAETLARKRGVDSLLQLV